MNGFFYKCCSLRKIVLSNKFFKQGRNNTAQTAAILYHRDYDYDNRTDGGALWYGVELNTKSSSGVLSYFSAEELESEEIKTVTFYASIEDLDNDLKYIAKHSTLVNLAKTVRSFTGTNTKMTIEDMKDALNDNDVFESGKQAQYDAFWDKFQNYGNRTKYPYAFYGDGWTTDILKPKYSIELTAGANCAYMFSMLNYNKEVEE